jgi:hypothetical protein
LEIEEIKREYELEIEWRCLDGISSTVVPQHARFADLCILSQDVSAAVTATGYTFSEEPDLHAIRGDPRFKTFLKKMNLLE